MFVFFKNSNNSLFHENIKNLSANIRKEGPNTPFLTLPLKFFDFLENFLFIFFYHRNLFHEVFDCLSLADEFLGGDVQSFLALSVDLESLHDLVFPVLADNGV